jgi:microsomal dipeptidase-like Zn-dependent dipeptidase
MEAKDFVDAENHLSDNTIDIAKSLDGMRGVNFVNDFVKRYGQNLF